MGSGDDKRVFMQFRVEKALKKAFERVCKNNDMTASQVLRAHMRDYVQASLGQDDLFDTPKKGKKGDKHERDDDDA